MCDASVQRIGFLLQRGSGKDIETMRKDFSTIVHGPHTMTSPNPGDLFADSDSSSSEDD